jgi:hypothetical protein
MLEYNALIAMDDALLRGKNIALEDSCGAVNAIADIAYSVIRRDRWTRVLFALL